MPHWKGSLWEDMTSQQRQDFVVVLWTLGSLTLLGTLCIIILHLCCMRGRTVGKRIIVLLATCDMITVLTFLLSPTEPPDPGGLCRAQGFLQDVFTDASMFCTASYAWYLHQLVKNPRSVRYRGKWAMWYYVIPFVYPVLVAIVNVSAGLYEPSGFWCWVGSQYEVIRWCEFYLVLLIIFIFNVWIYVSTLRTLRRHNSTIRGLRGLSGANRSEIRLGWRISLYLLIFIVCWIPGFANRFQNLLDPGNSLFFLNMMELSFILIQGFLNALVYSANFLTDRSRRKHRLRQIDRLVFTNPERAAALRKALLEEESDDVSQGSRSSLTMYESQFDSANTAGMGQHLQLHQLSGDGLDDMDMDGDSPPDSPLSHSSDGMDIRELRAADEAMATPLIMSSGVENAANLFGDGSLATTTADSSLAGPPMRLMDVASNRFAAFDTRSHRAGEAVDPVNGEEPSESLTVPSRVSSAQGLWLLEGEDRSKRS